MLEDLITQYDTALHPTRAGFGIGEGEIDKLLVPPTGVLMRIPLFQKLPTA